MRKIIFTQVALLLWGLTNGQCIVNGGLESSCTGNGFNNNCVEGWTASHGTPSVFGVVGTNTWAWLWSHSNTGEGIISNYNFIANRTYQLSFKVRASTSVSNPTAAVRNSTLNVRATSGITGSTSTTIPTPSNSQNIWNITVANAGNAWQTITVNYTPTANFSQVWFYPLMTADSNTNGSAQIQMEVDDINIIPPVTSVFHFQNANNVQKTDFCAGESIFLNGTSSFGENQYYIDVWRRPRGSTGAFQWQTQLGQNGWTTGQVGVLNLSSLFGTQNFTFSTGYEYQVKLATASSPCVGWVETTHTFRVLNNTASPAFTFNTFCAANGTITATATALDTSIGINQWWALMETSIAGSTSDATTIGQVGAVQNGNTANFTGLSRTRHYYIKHGVYGSCTNWTEQRTALPQSATWSNYTTDFNLAPSGSLNGTVTVTAAAFANPVVVSHHWSIFYAPNGSTSGSTNVTNNPDQCCNSATATFSANLAVNQWYYIKHGIWNDCVDWNETRKAFRVVVQGLLANGSPNYIIETAIPHEEITDFKKTMSISNKEENYLSPNLASTNETIRFTTKTSEITEVAIIDFRGTTEKILFDKIDEENIEFRLNNHYKQGIYAIKVSLKKQPPITKKIVIQ